LLSLKHMGSIEKISTGLTSFCLAMNDSQIAEFCQLSKTLVEKLFASLESNDFKVILRRSAGIPFAVVALIKAHSIYERNSSLSLLIKRLFAMSDSLEPLV